MRFHSLTNLDFLSKGCPQNIAKRGHYGSFLQDEWDLISSMIKQATEKFDIPITCKIRILNDEKRTIEYAKMIERSGCYLLTVHGRTREQKGQFTGLADWNIIKKVKEALSIPVFANGNIQRMEDAEDCLKFTGVDGVMSAEGLQLDKLFIFGYLYILSSYLISKLFFSLGLLYNPALFKSLHVPAWIIIDEYLEICRTSSIISNVFIKAHLFKMVHLSLQQPEHHDLRKQLSKAVKLEEFQAFSNELRKRFETNEDQIVEMKGTNYPLPHYLTQAYFRRPNNPTDLINTNNTSCDNEKPITELNKKRNKHKLNDEETVNENTNGELNDLSTSKKSNGRKKLKVENEKSRKLPSCMNCLNPKSLSCDHERCKICCKIKCFESDVQFTCKGKGDSIQFSSYGFTILKF